MCDKEDKCDLKNLTDYDRKINEIKRGEIYNGTVLVCIVYGLFAVSILLASYLSEHIRDIFFNEFIIFTIIFIIGSIVIISVLFYYINNYQPKKTKHINSYDTYSCPDYWKMVMLDDTEVAKNFDSNISPNYFKYKCVLNNDIFDKYGNYKTSFPNSNLNYSLTNNIYNTISRPNTIKGDYYNSAKDAEIIKNIKLDNGHLYKTINNQVIFPLSNTSNYYAYNKPGQTLLNTNMSNIRTAIIDSSLKMNNYSFDTKSNLYTNINTYSITDKYDPYITWNARNNANKQKYEKATLGEIGVDAAGNNIYYENYYVLSWYNGNNINYNYYKALFNDTAKIRYVYAYKGNINQFNSQNFIQLGTINIEDNNIYFNSIPRSNSLSAGTSSTSLTDFLINNTPSKIPQTNTYMVQSYINIKDNDTPQSRSDVTIGPIMTFDNGIGRPPTITKEQIEGNTISIPVVCDTVYPAYLASIEDQNLYGSDNTIRCSYAKLCGYSWSDMGCN